MSNGVAVLQDHLEGQQKRVRQIFTYEIPLSVGGDVRAIGFVELTASEERMAVKRAGNDHLRIAQEMAKQSLVEINGKPVTLADGSVDTIFEHMRPQVRELVVMAFGEVNGAAEDTKEAFLKSRRVKV